MSTAEHSQPALVSVVVPCYNATPYIEATLRSVFAQEGVSLEVILVDDGSDDGSAQFVASRFPAVTIYRTDNQGPGAARNYGTARCSGEYIQYLDADDLLAAGKLPYQLSVLWKSDADIAYGDWLKFDVQPDGTRIVQGRFKRRIGTVPDVDLFTGFWCPLAAYLIRRRVLDKVGWRTDFPVIQDARFMQDCALNGSQFIYSEGLVAEYRVHRDGSVSTRSRVAFLDDCLRNALEIQTLWQTRGQMTDDRRLAVIGVLDMVANGSVGLNRSLFERACRALSCYTPPYPSGWSATKRAAVTAFGYRRSISAAYRIRSSVVSHQRSSPGSAG